jgi:adhesin transport system outer membrane protein
MMSTIGNSVRKIGTWLILSGLVLACSFGVSHARRVMDLSLNSAVLFALHNNPDIGIFLERLEQADNSVKESEGDLYPQVTLNIEGGREYNDPAYNTDPQKNAMTFSAGMGITLEQLLFDGFGTVEEIRRREKISESAFWKAQAKIEEVLTNTVETYLEIVRYQEETQIITELLEDIRGTIDYITDQYEAGAVGKVVLDYANSRLANAVTELNRAESSLNDAVSNLEFLTGKLPPEFNTYYPELLSPDKLDLQYYLEQLEKKNSQIIANEYEIEAMEHQLQVQKAKDYPEINFVASANQTHNSGGLAGTEKDASASVQLSYSLFDGGKRKHAKQRIKSQIEELDIRKSRVVKELRREIKLSYNQIQANFSALSITEEEISSSIALKELNEENFRLGNINVIELIESAERLNAAYLKKVNLTSDMYFNSYRLLLLASTIDQTFFCASC